MREKFIKLTTGTYDWYVDPFMITSIGKSEEGKVVLYLFNGHSIYPDQDVETILKMVKQAESFKLTT